MLRNKPTVDESTSEATGVYVEVCGESKPTPAGAKTAVRVDSPRAGAPEGREERGIASEPTAPRPESDPAARDEAPGEPAANPLHPVPVADPGVSSLSSS